VVDITASHGGNRLAYNSLDGLFLTGHTTEVAWKVEFTDEFETWWGSLSEGEQEEISAKVDLLEERGPTLSRPHADVIVSSRHANMKELRARVEERQLRVRLHSIRVAPLCF
jgi:hypothetical protein